MRSFRAQHNLFAVSANARETAVNTEQTLDTTLLIGQGDMPNVEPRRESNADELTGKEEPDTIYDLGSTGSMTVNFPKAQPQHFAFLLAYALGSTATAAAGDGYQHTITPIAGDLDLSRSLPTFTSAFRFGDAVLKRRFASMAVDQFTGRFSADSWVQCVGQLKSTGKAGVNLVEEEITAADDVTTLTLATAAVHGSTAAERLASVHQVRVELASGVWTEVAFSAVSSATPAAITITAPGATSTDKTYKVLYAPTEAAWCTFPSRVTETPLRVAEMTLKLGGAWNGTAFAGGRTLTSELRSLEWTLNNSLAVEFVPGAGEAYAGRIFRDGRTQTLKLDREMREYVLQNLMARNETFGVYILCEGAVYDDPHKYQVEIIFPKVGVLKAPVSVNGKRLAEAGDLQVLEDDAYGSVIVKIKNLVSAYAA